MKPPSVHELALSIADVGLPHPLAVVAARTAIAAGDPAAARAEAHRLRRSLLGSAINATGVLLHTNLGRAPRSADHAAASWSEPIAGRKPSER